MSEILKVLFENLAFSVWIMDLDFKYIYVNNKYVEGAAGKTKEDFIGKTNEEIFNEYLSDMFNKHCLKAVQSKATETIEMFSGNDFKTCTIIPLLNDDNEVIGIAGIIGMEADNGKIHEKDTEIEAQKNLTRHMMDLLPGVVFYKDKNSRYIYANAECREFYRKKGINNILGKTDEEINSDSKLSEKFLEDDRRVLENKETIYNEAVFQRPNGKKEYREVVKMPLVDSAGEVLGIIGRSIDVTKQKQVEEKLKYLSYIDILTGIKNRTSFEERIQELNEADETSIGFIMGDANGLKIINDTLGHQEGDRLLINVAEILRTSCEFIGKGEVYRIGGDEFVIIILGATMADCDEIIAEILKRCSEFEDEKFNISIALGKALRVDKDKTILSVLKEADDNSYIQKLKDHQGIKSSILNTLKTGSAARSFENDEHTERVSFNAIKVGRQLGLNIAEILELKIAGEIHDIGKVAINDEVLEKPGKLTDEEYEIIKTHTEKGYHLVKATNDFRNIADGVLCHHERWDGKGYPLGLKGEEIPLISRIISVVDAYDVMTNGRVYQKAVSVEAAITELRRCAGTQFDPRIVEAFIASLEEIES